MWNYQWERLNDEGYPAYFYAPPNEYIQNNSGFDWDIHLNTGTGAGCSGVLGYGLYKIDIQRNPDIYAEETNFETIFIW